MKEIKRFIECLIPVTACNMRCSYCYVIQESRREDKVPELKYGLDVIARATTEERFGGTCFFNICGAGETLIPSYTIDLLEVLLNNGHYVNVTTNGTLTKRFDEMLERFDREQFGRMQFAFSYHYLELMRLHKLDAFFENVRRVHEAGASIIVQMNLCDEYIPVLDEAVSLCKEKAGAVPQFAATRREEGYPVSRVVYDTKLTDEEYVSVGKRFSSPLFNYTVDNFNVNRRGQFCYAGDWTFILNLCTGVLRRCYASCLSQNIFEHPDRPIRLLAVGKHCNSPYCFNSSHYLAQGNIPELDTPSYVEVRNRPEARLSRGTVGWYQEPLKTALSGKLSEANEQYGPVKRLLSGIVGSIDSLGFSAYSFLLNHRKRR